VLSGAIYRKSFVTSELSLKITWFEYDLIVYGCINSNLELTCFAQKEMDLIFIPIHYYLVVLCSGEASHFMRGPNLKK